MADGGNYHRGGGYRGGWRGGGQSGGRYSEQYDRGYQGGGRGTYDSGYQGGRGGYQSRGGYQAGRGGYNDYQGGRGAGYDGYQGPRGYDSSRPRSDYYDGVRGGRSSGRGRYNWGRGGGRHTGPPPKQRQHTSLPDDVALLTELKKHDKQVTCLYYDPGTQQLYSGSSDGTICAWSCSSGQMMSSDNVAPFGVDSIRVEAGYMFVGMSKGDEGIVKVYNLATGHSHMLTGHKGQVYGLAVANNALFTAGQDCSIRVWQFNDAAGIFMSQTILTADSGDGHRAGVHSLTVLGQYMFSGDRTGILKVWDLSVGQCVQTVVRAHDQAITSIMGWGENYLLTCSLDGTIKVWSPGSSSSDIINTQPEFRYPEEEGGGRGYRQDYTGIVTMFGSADAAGKSVLMLANVRERCIKLLELPTFTERGVLPDVFESRALSAIPEHNIMIAGDKNGSIKVFQWKS